MRLSPLDWTFLVAYLLGIVSVGIYFSKRQTSTNEFFLAGRRFGSFTVSLSLLATGLSAVSLLGVPGFVIAHDWSTFYASMMGLPASLLVAWFFVPFFYNLKLTSTYEYLQRRFDTKVAVLGGILFLVMRGFLAGIAIYAPSIALCAVTGWNLNLCIIISGIMTLFYTSLGGMSAVVWTDIIQVIVLYSGISLIIIRLVHQLPGHLTDWVGQSTADHKFNILNFQFSWVKLTFWGSMIGGLFYNVAFFGVDQVLVQRYLASKSLKQAQKSLYYNSVYTIPSGLVLFVIGTLLYLYLRRNPELFPADLTPDQIFPYYILRHLPVGFAGILIAAVYAAAMGQLSSVLNSLATVSVHDFYKRFWKPDATEQHYVQLGRRLTIAWGVFAICTALITVYIDRSVWMGAVKASSVFLGPMLGMFLLGMVSERTTSNAAFYGCLIGLAVSLPAAFGTRLELFWLALFGTITTMMSGAVISLLAPATHVQRLAFRPYTLSLTKDSFSLAKE
jgi:solute:Na+ symporter, SSS family